MQVPENTGASNTDPSLEVLTASRGRGQSAEVDLKSEMAGLNGVATA